MLAALQITGCLMKYRCCLHWAHSRGSQVLNIWVLLLLLLGWAGKAEAQELVITEFMADADFGLADEDGELQDWIELYNPSSQEVSIEGWHLTDNAGDLSRWRFPAGTIGPRGYRVVFASGKDRRDPAGFWHTNFKLEREGEYLALVRPDGVTRSTEFSPQFPAQLAGASYGLGMTEERHTLVGESWPGRVRVPTEGVGGADWTLPGYDDGSWLAVEMGIGYERPEAGGGNPDPAVGGCDPAGGCD